MMREKKVATRLGRRSAICRAYFSRGLGQFGDRYGLNGMPSGITGKVVEAGGIRALAVQELHP